MNLIDYLQQAQQKLFRFESFQEFNIPSERADIEYWKKTGTINLHSQSLNDWWNFIDLKRKLGVILQRVRLVKFPLSEYTKFELDIFKETTKHGDDIRIITEDAFNELPKTLKDFWLIDDITLLNMNYSSSGGYEGFEIKREAQRYVQYKNILLEKSIILKEFSGNVS